MAQLHAGSGLKQLAYKVQMHAETLAEVHGRSCEVHGYELTNPFPPYRVPPNFMEPFCVPSDKYVKE